MNILRRIIYPFLILSMAGLSYAAVGVGDTSEGVGGTGTSRVLSHTLAEDDNYLGFTIRVNTNDSVVSVNANQEIGALTLRSSATAAGLCVEYVYEKVGPGYAGDIIITATTSNGTPSSAPQMAAISFKGVNQSDPVHAVAQWIGEDGYYPTTSHVDVDGVADGMIFDGMGGSLSGNEMVPGAGQTNVMTSGVTGSDVGTSYRTSAVGNNVMSWGDTFDNGSDLIIIAVSLNPVGDAPAGGSAFSISGLGNAGTAGSND